MTDATQPGATSSVKPIIYPFTLRELVVFGVFVLYLIISFLPAYGYGARFGYGGYYPLWTRGLIFLIPGFLLPLSVVVLFLLRRLLANFRLSVGSLSIDQYASVVAVTATTFYFTTLFGGSLLVGILGLLVSLVFLAATVFAKFLPFFATEFTERPEVVAHPYARPQLLLAKPAPRPVPVYTPPPAAAAAPAAAAPAPAAPAAAAPAPVPSPAAPARVAPYWILVPEDRAVVDANGATLFTITPAAWAAVIEDRGSELVVRHEDGVTVGVLREISGLQYA